MDKAVRVWRRKLGAYVMLHLSCQNDHVWREQCNLSASVEAASCKFRSDLCVKTRLIGGRSTETKRSVSFSCTQAAVLFITLA